VAQTTAPASRRVGMSALAAPTASRPPGRVRASVRRCASRSDFAAVAHIGHKTARRRQGDPALSPASNAPGARIQSSLKRSNADGRRRRAALPRSRCAPGSDGFSQRFCRGLRCHHPRLAAPSRRSRTRSLPPHAWPRPIGKNSGSPGRPSPDDTRTRPQMWTPFKRDPPLPARGDRFEAEPRIKARAPRG
jgi:hypothetical protein